MNAVRKQFLAWWYRRRFEALSAAEAPGITHALDFTGQSATGQGGRADSDVLMSPAGLTTLTASYYCLIRDEDRLQWGMGEWGQDGPNESCWIWAPSSSAEYGAGNDGMSFWFERADNPSRAYFGRDVAEPYIMHGVARFDGNESAQEDRLRIWLAMYSLDGDVIEAWGEKTVQIAFMPVPDTLLARPNGLGIHVGGATYSSAYDADGLIGLAAAWDTAIDPAVIAAMHDPATRQPTAISLVGTDPVYWMQPTAGDLGASAIANRGTAGGTITFEEGTDGGAPEVVTWSEAG